jgi:hypothetical protein
MVKIISEGIRPETEARAASNLSRAGFSLIEVLISMAITFFLLTGMAEMLCYSLLLKQKGDLHQIAADIISRKIEILKSLEPEHDWLSPGLHQETVKDENSERLFLLGWEVAKGPDGLKKIQLTLHPVPPGSQPGVRAILFRSEELGF